MTRDLWLVGQGDGPVATVIGLANAWAACLGDSARVARIGLVREIVDRHASLTLTVAPALATYRPDMTEAELRAWAAGLVACLS